MSFPLICTDVPSVCLMERGDHWRSVHIAIPARIQDLVKFSSNSSNHKKTQPSQACSEALIVIYANIEGLSANKTTMLSDLCKSEHCHCLQETHRASDYKRSNISGMTLVAEIW